MTEKDIKPESDVRSSAFPLSKEQISTLFSYYGSLAKGVKKRITREGLAQRRAAAKKPRPNQKAKPPAPLEPR